MGQQSLSSLKNTNRTFDNILDSYLNTSDTGLIMHNGTIVRNELDLSANVAIGGSTMGGAAGAPNQWTFRCGNTLQAIAIGTQTLLGPATTALGLDVSGDAADDDGWEYRGKLVTQKGILNKDYFTIGTSPAFYMKALFSVADVSDTDKVVMGFAKDEAHTATVANYNDLATIGILDAAGDVKTDTIVGNAANVTTDLTDITDWTDGDVKGFIVKVSATGEVTYLISNNGDSSGTTGAAYAASTDAVAYTFTDGLNVVPYWYHIHAAASSAGIVWHSMEWGLQKDAQTAV